MWKKAATLNNADDTGVVSLPAGEMWRFEHIPTDRSDEAEHFPKVSP